MQKNTIQATLLTAISSLLFVFAVGTLPASSKTIAKPTVLTPAGEKLQSEYAEMLKSLQAEVTKSLPPVDTALQTSFMTAHQDDGPKFQKQKPGSKEKPKQARDSGVYKDYKRQKATLNQARPLLAKLDGFLGSEAADRSLVKCAVLANATPQGLAEYAQQGTGQKALVDALLADHDLMKQMLISGGAKAGRYGKAMEILKAIRAASTKSNDGILGRLALATALELSAPELCNYSAIDPVKRYLAYEKWYLNNELDPAFKDMTTWECRHIINDYSTEEELTWLRTMVRNYRPDAITTPYPREKYMAVNGDIPQKTPEYEEGGSNIQAIVDKGGRCGPKATLGRATTRSFGIPTWGTRVKAHTGMTYWTPNGWTTALGVAWNDSYWEADKPERMLSTLFRLDHMARENPPEYLKALRCGWVGDALGQKKIDGMVSGTGEFWHALALNKKRAIVTDAWPNYSGNRVPWTEDSFALNPDASKRPENDSPSSMPTMKPEDRRIDISAKGVMTIPAAACISPTANTGKILFMESSLGGIQLHYRRKGAPETFTYEVMAPEAGDYQLSAQVVTINQEQSLQLKVNSQESLISLPLPYTVGMWQESKPIKIPLIKGKNTLSFTRTVSPEFGKLVWTNSGPEFGGISIRSFTLSK